MRVLPGHWKLSVIERCPYVQRGSTVLVAQGRMCVYENYAPSVRFWKVYARAKSYLGSLEACSTPGLPLEKFIN